MRQQRGSRSVFWLRHWIYPLALPAAWILACNGHRSNPRFLDSLRTLLELCDRLASNAFGTHLGYPVALDKSVHWLNSRLQQDSSARTAELSTTGRIELNQLSNQLHRQL